MADWTAIVGPAIAAIAAPRRLAAGTLTLGCTGAVAMELQHLALELIGRINTHLGSQAIHRLRFAQGAGPVALAAPAPALSCSPKAAAKVDAAVEALPQGPLRDALAALGRAMLAPRRASTARGESS